MYDVDHALGTATMLQISATLAAEVPNCVLMVSPVAGFVGSNSGAASNIYQIQVVGGVVTESLLNTTATVGSNCAQLALLAGRIYFCTQNAGVVGAIQSVPISGGPVTLDLDLATIGAVSLSNALCELGGKIYCATFNSGSTATTPGELVEYDPATGTGRIVMMLPQSGYAPSGTPFNIGVVKMRADPMNPAQLVLQGVYGEIVTIDPASASVVDQVWTGVYNATGSTYASGAVDSFDWDPIAQDWIVGTRDGFVEGWVGAGQAQMKIGGLGTGATPTENRVGGLYHLPGAAGSDATYGDGCRSTGGWSPIDSSYGAPQAGNPAFRFGLFSANAGDAAVLLVDVQNVVLAGSPLPIDLVSIGAPGCLVRTGNLIAVGVTTTGGGEGQGSATVALPIPVGAAGTVLYHQWIVLETVPTNALGIVVSNARRLAVQ